MIGLSAIVSKVSGMHAIYDKKMIELLARFEVC